MAFGLILEEQADFFLLAGAKRVIDRHPALAHLVVLFLAFRAQLVHALGDGTQIGARLVEQGGDFLLVFTEAFAAAVETFPSELSGVLPERFLLGIELEIIVQTLAETEAKATVMTAAMFVEHPRTTMAMMMIAVAARWLGKGVGRQAKGKRQGGDEGMRFYGTERVVHAIGSLFKKLCRVRLIGRRASGSTVR